MLAVNYMFNMNDCSRIVEIHIKMRDLQFYASILLPRLILRENLSYAFVCYYRLDSKIELKSREEHVDHHVLIVFHF
jgi:hypothetical protein